MLEPRGKGARASLQRLREKQGIPSDIVIESSEPAEETKFALDNRNAPDQETSKDVTRDRDTAIPSKKTDSKYELGRCGKRTNAYGSEPHVLPTNVPGLVADAPKVCTSSKSYTQSKMQDISSVDKRRNDLKSHILTLRDNGAMSGENGISSWSANLGRSVEHWRRLALLRSGDVEPNPGLPQAQSRGEGEFLCVDISAEIAAKFRRAFDVFDIFPSCGSCNLLPAHELQFVVETATRCVEWSFGFDELTSGAAGTLVVALR